MDFLCAIVDVQGSRYEGKFVPKELAFNVYGSEFVYCYEIIDKENSDDWRGALLDGDDYIPLDKFKIFLIMLYEQLKTQRDLFGVRSHTMSVLLEELDI